MGGKIWAGSRQKSGQAAGSKTGHFTRRKNIEKIGKSACIRLFYLI